MTVNGELLVMANYLRAQLSKADGGAEKMAAKMIGDLLDELKTVSRRAERFEKNMPSWAHGTPEDYDAWLRDLTPDDRRLKFYQWIGEHAVREAIADVKHHLGEDPVPVQHQHYDAQAVEEILDVVNPDEGPIALPSKLPLGRRFCDVDHHTHVDGGGRLPTCRLDSEE